eukprot:1148820-Pelagomonas_calceolata.AAC.7
MPTRGLHGHAYCVGDNSTKRYTPEFTPQQVLGATWLQTTSLGITLQVRCANMKAKALSGLTKHRLFTVMQINRTFRQPPCGSVLRTYRVGKRHNMIDYQYQATSTWMKHKTRATILPVPKWVPYQTPHPQNE